MCSRPAFLLLALLALPAAGLEPYLVKDINPGHQPGTSFPDSFVALGGAALFQADDGRSGRELWRSDGTEAGTWLVADLCPGECWGLPVPLVATDRLLFFTSQEGPAHPKSLWATDGTPGGTVSLTRLGADVGEDALWAQSHGALYFSLSDALYGSEVWRSDGTPGGTFPLVATGRGPRPRGFTLFRGRVWFAAEGERGGGALWRTDGTPGGTEVVKDFVAESDAPVVPRFLQAVGKRLVFVAPGPNGGDELWASDGTARGTAPLTRLTRGKARPVFYGFQRFGPRLYFVADDGRHGQELWVTDGTARGTRVLTSFTRKDAFYSGELPLPTGLTGGRLVFAADDGPHGAELWITDGTAKGTRLVRDVCPGACPAVDSLWRTHRGLLYWVGTDGASGQELWATDGTAKGTRLVRDIREGEQGSFPADPIVLGDRLLFTANDLIHSAEVWSTDGTAPGTFRATDFVPGFPIPSFKGVVVDGKLLFGAHDGFVGTELWSTDGTIAGTALVRDINDLNLASSFPAMLGALGDTAFFFLGDVWSPFELWKSDGTDAGTTLVGFFKEGEEPVLEGPDALAQVAGGRLFFPMSAGERQLWRTDGTEAGTFPVTGAGVALCCLQPVLRAVGDLLFFAARDYDHGNELWVSDGSAEGTRQVEDLRPGPIGSEPQDLVAFQGQLYFMAANADGSRGLWSSDGTAAGTELVADLGIGHTGPSSLLTVHAGRLWFFVGKELWSSDGTAAGTALAVAVAPGSQSFNPNLMVSLRTMLVFSGLGDGELEGLWATNGVGKVRIAGAWQPGTAWAVFQGWLFYTAVHHFEPTPELTVTDGTPELTRLLPFPGAGFDPAISFAPLGDRLLFTSAGGRRLWETEGTVISPVTAEGFEPAEWGRLISAGPRVFLAGSSPETGVELWAVRPDAP